MFFGALLLRMVILGFWQKRLLCFRLLLLRLTRPDLDFEIWLPPLFRGGIIIRKHCDGDCVGFDFNVVRLISIGAS